MTVRILNVQCVGRRIHSVGSSEGSVRVQGKPRNNPRPSSVAGEVTDVFVRLDNGQTVAVTHDSSGNLSAALIDSSTARLLAAEIEIQ